MAEYLCTITFRVTQQMKEKLQSLATREGRKVGDVIRRILAWYLSHE